MMLLRHAPTIALITLFTACGGGGGSSPPPPPPPPAVESTNGSIHLNGPVEGAKVSVKGLSIEEFNDTVCRQVGYIPDCEPVEIGNLVSDASGQIEVVYDPAKLEPNSLYLVTFKCDDQSACELGNDVHIVLTSAQFQAGDWQANVLSEVVYQKLVYYVAAEYSVEAMVNYMSSLAPRLLNEDISGDGQRDYRDLPVWSGENGFNKVRKPIQLQSLADRLETGEQPLALQRHITDLLSPVLATYGLQEPLPSIGLYYCQDHPPRYDADAQALYVVCHVSKSNDQDILARIDVSNPSAPALIGHETIKPGLFEDQILYGYYHDEALVGDIAYTPTRNYQLFPTEPKPTGLQAVDISDRDNPEVLDTLPLLDDPDHFVQDIAVADDRAYVLMGTRSADNSDEVRASLYTADVSNPAALRQIAYTNPLDGVDGNGAIAVRDGIAYLSGHNATIRLYDVSAPAAPSVVATVTPSSPPELADEILAPLVKDGRLYVAARDLEIWDISDPTEPRWLASLDTDKSTDIINPSTIAFVVDDRQLLYRLDSDRLTIFDLDTSAKHQRIPAVGSYTFNPGDAGVFHSNWASTLADGLIYFAWRNFFGDSTPGTSRIVISVLDPSNPNAFKTVGELPIEVDDDGPTLEGLSVQGELASLFLSYFSDSVELGRLQLIDISDPASPARRGSVQLTDFSGVFAVRDDRAYVISYPDEQLRLSVYDLGASASPRLLTQRDLPIPSAAVADDLFLEGDAAYLLGSRVTDDDPIAGRNNREAFIYRIDLSNDRLELKREFDLPAEEGGRDVAHLSLSVSQGYAFVGYPSFDDDASIAVFDLNTASGRLNSLHTISARSPQLEIAGQHGYTLGESSIALDLDNPAKPELIGILDTQSLYPSHIGINDGLIYFFRGPKVETHRALPQP